MIILTDEDLRPLERHFGPDVRHMGPWNSDGVFGFCSVSVALVEKAAEAVGQLTLTEALERLKNKEDRTRHFVEIVEAFGPKLVQEIAALYRDSQNSGVDDEIRRPRFTSQKCGTC